MAWHTEFDEAWNVVKMPILEPQPGIKFGYNSLERVNEPQQAIDDMVDDSRYLDHRDYQLIGMPPYAWNNRDAIKYMTPDEYFDIVYSGSDLDDTPYDEDFSYDPGRGEGDRWKSGYDPDKETLEEAHDRQLKRIIQGIKEGKIIGMPELLVSGDNDEYEGMQEGGHRMDALRRLGFANTPVPVFLHRGRL